MRALPVGFAQKLEEGVTTLALAWRLNRTDGLQVAVTQHDRDLRFDGTLFVAAQGLLGNDHERGLALAPDRTALSGAMTIGAITETDLALGLWDHATVEAFWVDWASPNDFIHMWTGLVAGASWRGSAFELDIVGREAVLNREIGQVYARTCSAALGDARCKVDLATSGRTLQAVIVNLATHQHITIAAPIGKVADDFVGGAVTLGGSAASSWRSDITHIDTTPSHWQITLSRAFPLAPVPGDTLQMTMGCDKSFATCKGRFANILNFRGQHTMPGDDVAFGGPASIGNNGGKR